MAEDMSDVFCSEWHWLITINNKKTLLWGRAIYIIILLNHA